MTHVFVFFSDLKIKMSIFYAFFCMYSSLQNKKGEFNHIRKKKWLWISGLGRILGLRIMKHIFNGSYKKSSLNIYFNGNKMLNKGFYFLKHFKKIRTKLKIWYKLFFHILHLLTILAQIWYTNLTTNILLILVPYNINIILIRTILFGLLYLF